MKILTGGRISGSVRDIRGGYSCVCFSEAPISAIGQVLARQDSGIRYGPYGFMFSKDYLFEQGARPVLYQTEEEYALLPEELQYKHVKLELARDPKVDWSCEREWRQKADYLNLDIRRTTLILPTRVDMEEFIHQYQMSMREIGNSFLGTFPQVLWHFIILEDLGFVIC